MTSGGSHGFAALWAELEKAAAHDPSRWWLVRCRATPGRSLFVAREPDSGRRALLLPLDGVPPPPRRHWPRLAVLEPVTIAVDGAAHVGVALVEARFADVFDALAVDLARRIEEAADARAAVRALLGQLARWKKFLAAASGGLGEEAQRGLWGELACLRDHLLPALGPEEAVLAWRGPHGAAQDFQCAGGAVEVKTTVAKQPQAVRITSERQLDDREWPSLFLHVLVLDGREGGPATLPALVTEMRSRLTGTPVARETFEDALLAAGWLDAHAADYAGRGYVQRAAHWFKVRGRFPRLVERDLPHGIGAVGYALDLAACERFAVARETALARLARRLAPKKRLSSRP